MKTYEALVLFSLRTEGEALQHGKAVFEGMLNKQEGKLINCMDLGKRPLGYTIKKAKEGYALVFDFELSPERVESLKHLLRLSEEILKFTVIVKVQPKQKKKRIKKTKKERPVHTGSRS